jgi:hypothetical protein
VSWRPHSPADAGSHPAGSCPPFGLFEESKGSEESVPSGLGSGGFFGGRFGQPPEESGSSWADSSDASDSSGPKNPSPAGPRGGILWTLRRGKGRAGPVVGLQDLAQTHPEGPPVLPPPDVARRHRPFDPRFPLFRGHHVIALSGKAARTIARMPARIASGSVGQAATTAARSGSL